MFINNFIFLCGGIRAAIIGLLGKKFICLIITIMMVGFVDKHAPIQNDRVIELKAITLDAAQYNAMNRRRNKNVSTNVKRVSTRKIRRARRIANMDKCNKNRMLKKIFKKSCQINPLRNVNSNDDDDDDDAASINNNYNYSSCYKEKMGLFHTNTAVTATTTTSTATTAIATTATTVNTNIHLPNIDKYNPNSTLHNYYNNIPSLYKNLNYYVNKKIIESKFYYTPYVYYFLKDYLIDCDDRKNRQFCIDSSIDNYYIIKYCKQYI